MISKVIITGGNGQLAKSIKNALPTTTTQYIFLGSQELNITNLDAVLQVFENEKP